MADVTEHIEWWATNPNNLPEDAKSNISMNILRSHTILDELVELTAAHLRVTGEVCFKCCLGLPAAVVIEDMNPATQYMVLGMALRVLAEGRQVAQVGKT